ncbi:DUF6101 family protein [Terrarubrum flagellatum]|uniref:DUF6101 family protein n=1 Tax=Terrirubrum flagellatum TaxID=2895980 RepID=UPI003144DD9D
MTDVIAGVSITRRLPNSRFVGVMASERADDPAESEIALLRDDGVSVVLSVQGDADVVAEWRAASRSFGLPMIVQRPDAGVIALEAMIGPLLLGKAHSGRRMRALTRSRRPRFLMRRQTTRLPLAPIVHHAVEMGR